MTLAIPELIHGIIDGLVDTVKQALPGNPYDGHTAEAVLKQLKRITGTQPEILIADCRYRGEKDYGKTPLLAPSRPSTADTEYKKSKQRKRFRKRAVA